MKIFLSWSGKPSLNLAQAFKEWLPTVFQSVVPFLSTKDIAAGEPWQERLSKVLEDHDFGIVCLTRANLSSPYVMFESGALAKRLGEARLVPVLYDLSEGELVRHPLTQFQYIHLTPEGMWKLAESINANLGDKMLSSDMLKKTFDKWLPDFWNKVAATPELSELPKKKIDLEASMEEILSIVRGLAREKPNTVFFDLWREATLNAAVHEALSREPDAQGRTFMERMDFLMSDTKKKD